LTTTRAVRLLALSHASSAGQSAFRIRIEDSQFNNLMVEMNADFDVHKFGAHILKDSSSNGVHLFANDVCCRASTSATSSTISVTRDLFVFYEVRIETAAQQWTSDFLVAELISDL